MKTQLSLMFTALTLGASLIGAHAQGTAFTYQGRLNDGANPANGIYDLRFAIYDSTNNPGVLIAGPLTNAASVVSNGLFMAILDFGPGVFDGTPRFLEIGVRTNGGSGFTVLAPRQALTPTPYAIFANTASNLLGAISSGQLSGTYSGPVQFNNGADSFDGTFVGQFFGSTFTGGNFTGNFLGSGNGLFDVWHTGGNAGTTAGVNFVGTTDSQPLEFKVGGIRVLRLEPDGRGFGVGNLIGGLSNNVIEQSGSGGDFIGGGGFSGGGGNIIHSNSSGVFIGAGSANQIGPNVNDAVIVGGIGNSVGQSAYRSFIGSGYSNMNGSPGSVIGGGEFNSININGVDNSIGGGYMNSIATNNYESFIGGGNQNVIGPNNYYSAIGGGINNSILSQFAVSFIGGGYQNTISTNGGYSQVVGGYFNTNNGYASFLGGGNNNLINADASVVSGGSGNNVGGQYSFIGGGIANLANGFLSTSVGGQGNAAAVNNSTIVGGLFNTNFGVLAFMGGGDNNFAGGYASVISGGESNRTFGQFSMAAGYHAGAFNDGTFVWSDFEPANFSSTSSNQFLIRAQNGVGINTNNPQAALHVNGTIIANNFSGSGSSLNGLNFSQLSGTLLSSQLTGSYFNPVSFSNPADTFTGDGSGLTALNSAQLVNGPIPGAVLFGTYAGLLTFNNVGNSFTGNGAGLTSLNAGAVSTGTLPDARLSANVALLNRSQQFVGVNSFLTGSNTSSGLVVVGTTGIDLTKFTGLGFQYNTSTGEGAIMSSFDDGFGLLAFYTKAALGQPLTKRMVIDRTGNVGIGTNTPVTRFQVVNATCDGNNWVNASDRNLKENFTSVEPLAVLAKVAALPIQKWNYKSEPAQEHLGPVAQDFRAAFELGPDDKHIATVDEGGVALAAIQGLNQKLEEQRGELKLKETEITELKQRLERLEEIMSRENKETE